MHVLRGQGTGSSSYGCSGQVCRLTYLAPNRIPPVWCAGEKTSKFLVRKTSRFSGNFPVFNRGHQLKPVSLPRSMAVLSPARLCVCGVPTAAGTPAGSSRDLFNKASLFVSEQASKQASQPASQQAIRPAGKQASTRQVGCWRCELLR